MHAFLLSLLFCFCAYAQAADPPLWTVAVDDPVSVLTTHSSGDLSLSTVLDAECVVVTSHGRVGQLASTQSPPTDPIPVIRTAWVDKGGVTHEVTTPIVSSTEAGLQRAIDLHDRLVAIMQMGHPPRPVGPSPPPVPIPPTP
jgi:hypothetical protein